MYFVVLKPPPLTLQRFYSLFPVVIFELTLGFGDDSLELI